MIILNKNIIMWLMLSNRGMVIFELIKPEYQSLYASHEISKLKIAEGSISIGAYP